MSDTPPPDDPTPAIVPEDTPPTPAMEPEIPEDDTDN